MGTHTTAPNMATSQMFLALCVVGMAMGAPQLSRGRQRSQTGVNEDQVVSNVITALEPSIAQAIQEALAGLSFNNVDAEAAAAAAALERDSFEAELSNDLGPNVRPVYNYEYKVADEDAQTYISKSEQRDGDELSGSYSFVDSTGSLITVNYNAGVDGYTETRNSEKGFVQIRAIPPWTGELAGVPGSGTTVARGPSTSTASGSSFGSGSGSRASSAFGSSRGSSSSSSLSSSSISSSVNQGDLISRIIAALQPQISAAVTSALT